MKQFFKTIDFHFIVKPSFPFWGPSQFESLYIVIAFPLTSCFSWQIRRTPKLLSMVRELRRLFEEDYMATRVFLRQFLLASRRLPSMPKYMV